MTDKKVYNKFNEHGAYKCSECGKLTRETGEGESDYSYCVGCFLEMQEENQRADNRTVDEEEAIILSPNTVTIDLTKEDLLKECEECGGLFDEEEIQPSGLCGSCQAVNDGPYGDNAF